VTTPAHGTGGPTADLFAAIADELTHARPEVEPSRMFGSTGLKVRTKTFAMLVKGRLVVKLPRERVDHLVASGVGDRFDPGHGRPMREWVSLTLPDPATGRALVTEALTFVATAR
jgi:hypothetical protein